MDVLRKPEGGFITRQCARHRLGSLSTRFAEENPELVAALPLLKVVEPDEQETWEWLRAYKHLYEIAHQVEITDEAIQAVVREAKQRSGHPLLIIARHLLDETCAYTRLRGILPKE